MAEKDIIEMSVRELKRCWIVGKAVEKRITQRKAAELMDLSERQVRRLIRRFRREKEKGLIHRLRGIPSNRRIGEDLKHQVLRLYQTHYEGFGPTLAQEKLLECNKIQINRETLRQWLIEAKLWQKRVYRKAHRQWRERKACFGEMVQMDGSHHDWLEGRGPKMVLMAYVDDATGNVYGRFYDYEGMWPAMESFYFYAHRYGLPQSVYLDRHTTYKSNGKMTVKDELEGKEEPKSHFQKALGRLGVEVIHAYSPQAKGRVERQFATFQDRLIKEMRLKNIKTQEEANQFMENYLPGYNRRFSKPPHSSADLHRRSRDIKLVSALSVQTPHVLRNDNTVRHGGKFYQITDHFYHRRPKRLTVQERMDGKLLIYDDKRSLCFQEICEPEKKELKLKPKLKRKIQPPFPEKNHPWRKAVWWKLRQKKLTPTEAHYLKQQDYQTQIQEYVEREAALVGKEALEPLKT